MPTGSRKDVQSVEDGSEDEERQRCPICLNEPRPSERAVPDSCSHVYCLSCILRWAQVLQICPVDRRLFSSIYTQNPFLGYIRIPVKSLGISNREGCGCKETVENISKEKKTKLDENGEGRVNQSLKCDTDSSAVKKNKMKRETCSSQLLAQRHRRGLSGQQGATLSMLNLNIIETELMSEEEPEEKSLRPYRSNQWLPIPISSPLSYTQSILLRQCPRAPPPLPLQPILPTSPCSMGSGFPDLYGKICPVTCPKGPGRSGTRGSGSKGPGKKVENVRTTRSTRSRRGQNVTEESSSQSQQSGSCSSAGSDPNDVPASTSRQRNVGKKKAPTRRTRNTRKNASPQPVEEHEEESTGEERIDEPLEEAGTPEKTQADSPGQANEDVNKDVHSEHNEEDDQVTENEDQQNSLDCGSVSPPITREKEEEDMEEEQNKQLEVEEEPEWVEKEVSEEKEEAEEKVEAEVGEEETEEKVEDEVEEKETEENVEDEVEEKETEEKVKDEVEEKETEEKVEDEVEEKEPKEKVEDEVEEKEPKEKVEDEDEEKEPGEKMEEEVEEKEPEEKMEDEVEEKETEEKVEDVVEEKETEEKVEDEDEEKEPGEKMENEVEKEPENKMEEVEEKEPEDEVEEKESEEKLKDEVEEKETEEKVEDEVEEKETGKKVEDEVEEKVEKEFEDETKKKVEEKVEDEMEKGEKETVLAELEERGAAEQEDDQTSSQMECSEDEPEVESVSPKEECKSSSPSAEQLMTAVSTDPPNTGVTSSQDIMGLVMVKDPTPDSASKTEPDKFQNTSEQVCKTPELESPRPMAENGLHKDTSPSEKTLEESNTAEHLDNVEPIPMDCDSPSSVEMTLEEEMVQQTNTVLPSLQTPTVDQTSAQDAGQKQNPGQEQKSETSEDPKGTDKTERRQRKSRFHSPTTTWSPKNESRREAPRRSRSRSRERSHNTSSPRRNRGRDHDEERGSSRRNRSRERWGRRRTRSRSRNRSRSRSRSRSRNKPSQRSSSPERNDQAALSPRKRESWGGDGWRGGGHSSRNSNWRNNPDRPSREPNFPFNGSHYPPDISPDRGPENPPWVKDWRGNTDSRDHREQHWEDKSGDGPTDSWSRGGWGFDQGRPGGRGRGGSRAFGQFGESVDNGRQQRNAFSGTAHNSGGDSYSHFNDNRPGGKRKDNENTDMSLDRSGWSAASSWAVRRKLPADVQNYYSRRDRGTGPGGNIWNRQEDEQPAAGVSKQPEPPQSEPNIHIPNEAVPAPPTVLPPQLNMLGVMRFPVGPMGLPGAPINIPPPPFSLPTQIPVHMPPPGPPPPSLQIPVMAMQSLPPPPPPPPPVQQATVTILQTDSLPQVINTIPMTVKAPVRASPNKAPPSIAPSVAQPSSTTQSSSHSKAHADSSKKEKKLQIQEKAITEVKNAIKPYYQNKDITKDEYKEIVRKAVEKICHSKSGEVNTSKVANLVKAYVDKYKHARKNKEDKI